MTVTEKAVKIAKVLDAKKADNVKVIKVDKLTAMADFFVLATGSSNTHVKALSEEVEYQMKKEGFEGRIEGKASNWQLIDFSDVLVHVFTEQGREHYDLDKLWSDGEEIPFE